MFNTLSLCPFVWSLVASNRTLILKTLNQPISFELFKQKKKKRSGRSSEMENISLNKAHEIGILNRSRPIKMHAKNMQIYNNFITSLSSNEHPTHLRVFMMRPHSSFIIIQISRLPLARASTTYIHVLFYLLH